MIKNKSLHYDLDIEVYGHRLIFSFNEKTDLLIKKLKGYGELTESEEADIRIMDEGGYAGMFVPLFSKGIALIRCKRMPHTIYDLATIHHEIFHAVFNILAKKGIIPCSESEEAYAYLISHITEKIYARLKIKV